MADLVRKPIVALDTFLEHCVRECDAADEQGGDALLRKSRAVLRAEQYAKARGPGMWTLFLLQSRVHERAAQRHCAIARRADEDIEFEAAIRSGWFSFSFAAAVAHADQSAITTFLQQEQRPKRSDILDTLRALAPPQVLPTTTSTHDNDFCVAQDTPQPPAGWIFIQIDEQRIALEHERGVRIIGLNPHQLVYQTKQYTRAFVELDASGWQLTQEQDKWHANHDDYGRISASDVARLAAQAWRTRRIADFPVTVPAQVIEGLFIQGYDFVQGHWLRPDGTPTLMRTTEELAIAADVRLPVSRRIESRAVPEHIEARIQRLVHIAQEQTPEATLWRMIALALGENNPFDEHNDAEQAIQLLAQRIAVHAWKANPEVVARLLEVDSTED